MAKALTDDEQNLRRKARRRLIGAVALTLAVVVILPMVLDSEPRPAVQDIELRIPAPDKVGEFVPGVAVSEVAEIAPPAASAAEAASSPASPILAHEAVNPDPVAAKQDEPVVGDMQAPARTRPAVSRQSVEKPVDRQTGEAGFIVQVGAYASDDAANKEFGRLKKWGFRKAYTEKADGMTRVRVGPYTEREKAEEVRQMLEKHGLKPVVMSAR
jgi:DedD protein